MVEQRFSGRRLALGGVLWLAALLVAGMVLYQGVPDASAEHGGQPGGQVDHLGLTYFGTDGVTASLVSSQPGTAHLEVANPLVNGENFEVTIDDGPVTTVTLDIGGAMFSLHTSCSLPINPGLIFGPGNHNITGVISDPSLQIFFVQLGSGAVANNNCTGATPTETPTPSPTPTESPTPTPTPTESPTPSPTPTESPTPTPTFTPQPPPPTPTESPSPTPTPTVEVAALSAIVEKVLASDDPAAVGDEVTFTIALTVTSDEALSGVGMVDTYENAHLRYIDSLPAGCVLFANQPDSAHDLVACEVGDVAAGTHTFVFDLTFVAIASTTPDRTVNSVVAMVDGDQVGPATADVEVIEVLGVQLPPSGDGSLAARQDAGTWWLLVALAAALSVAGTASLATSIRR